VKDFSGIYRLVIWCGCLLVGGGHASGENRVWTDIKGRTLNGEIRGATDEGITILTGRGKKVNIKVANLSLADREFVKAWARANSGGRPRFARWPREVKVDKSAITIDASRDGKLYVYRTPHFEFRSDAELGKGLMKDISLAFEGTHKVIDSLPLGIHVENAGEMLLVVKLFEDARTYMRNGGPPNSAGVYSRVTNEVMVPLEYLGVKRVGGGLRKVSSSGYDNSTLRHEIVHQVMDKWLDHIPIWLAEGIAEYVGSAQYVQGAFRFNPDARENGLRRELKKNPGARLYMPSKLLGMTSSEWRRSSTRAIMSYYPSSLLLVYYLFHLEGEGDGRRIRKFFRQIDGERKGYEKYLTAYYTELRSGSSKLFQRNGPSTDYIYRQSKGHKKAIGELRSAAAKFDKEFVAAFKKVGVKTPLPIE
jgi:hypothetical protein